MTEAIEADLRENIVRHASGQLDDVMPAAVNQALIAGAQPNPDYAR